MSGRMELLKAYSSDDSSPISYWITLLNLFDKYKDELNVSDMRILVAECEELRERYNSIKKHTDKIEQADTNPNIYVHLQKLEARQHRLEYKKEEELSEQQYVAVAQ